MSELRLVPIGVGDAFSTRWYSSSFLVEYEDLRLLVDCPHPIRKMLHEATTAPQQTPCDVADVHAILLTHLHADHSSGLEGFGYFCHFVLQRKAIVYAHPLVSERLWEGHLAAGMEQILDAKVKTNRHMALDDYFDLRPLHFDAPTEIGPYSVECRLTNHHVPTTALRISTATRSLGYSSDTSFDSDLIDWLAKADRFVHETNYGIHTPIESLEGLPKEVRERMWLIHYPDQLDRESSPIEPLEQGRTYVV